MCLPCPPSTLKKIDSIQADCLAFALRLLLLGRTAQEFTIFGIRIFVITHTAYNQLLNLR